MRKTFIAVVGIGLTVAGCGTTFTNPFTGQPVTITAASVQQAAQAACGFLPTASTVAGILTADPAVATAEAVAGIICGAVTAQVSTTQGAVLRGGPVSLTAVVNGQSVKISGSFVAGGRLRRHH